MRRLALVVAVLLALASVAEAGLFCRLFRRGGRCGSARRSVSYAPASVSPAAASSVRVAPPSIRPTANQPAPAAVRMNCVNGQCTIVR
jgi:hypothetical protein